MKYKMIHWELIDMPGIRPASINTTLAQTTEAYKGAIGRFKQRYKRRYNLDSRDTMYLW